MGVLDTETARPTSLQQRAEAVPRDIFLGGPRRDFDKVGRHMLMLLLKEGLLPQHKVVDVGCGALRAGYWLIHFLDPGGYFGIEPNQKMLQAGREMILETGLEDEKRPSYSEDDQFDFTVFDGARFDFAVARSVWTHASKKQIIQMLDSFRSTATSGAKFLVSYLPAKPIGAAPGATGKKALWVRDYKGDEWIGASHQRKEGGLVAHNRSWIKSACDERGLTLQTIRGEVINRQRWLRITAP